MKNLCNYIRTKYSYRPSNRKSNIIKDLDEFNEIIAYCQSKGYEHTINEHGAIVTQSIMRDGWC